MKDGVAWLPKARQLIEEVAGSTSAAISLDCAPAALPSGRDRRRRAGFDQRNRIAQYVGAGALPDAVFGEMTAEGARPRDCVKQAMHMSDDRVQANTRSKFAF